MRQLFNLDNVRLRNKMMLLYVLCVFIPIVFTNVVFYQVTTENVKNQRMKDISRALEQIKNEFLAEIDDTLRISEVFAIDHNLNDILEAEYAHPADYVSAYDSYFRRILNRYTPYYSQVQNIKIYLDNPTLLHSGAIGFLSEEVKELDWYKALGDMNSNNTVFIRTRKEDSYAIRDDERIHDAFSIVRRMNYFNNNQWEKILKIELRMTAIQQVFSNLNLNGHLYLVNEIGHIEYTTNPAIEWRKDSIPYQDIELSKESIEFQTVYTGVHYLEDWRIIGTISEEEVFREVRKSREFIVWMALLNLLASTLIIIWISRSMHVRLVRILRHMKRVKNQHFDTINEGETRDEIGQLLGEFNRMTLQIKSLIDDVYIADIQRKSLEIERRKAQLNALQSQINPHFLFNALETIRMRSLMKHENETANIIHNMAKLFRSSLTWNKDRIAVSEELEFIMCFLEIQQYRFGDRLNYRIHVDPEAKKAIIPKMVFLPFVENASIHGIEPMKYGGQIDIAICKKGERLEFTIEDNGVGMSQEQLDRFYSYLDNDSELGERIGVQNVIYRLKLLYDDTFRMTIDSNIGQGTQVIITFPA